MRLLKKLQNGVIFQQLHGYLRISLSVYDLEIVTNSTDLAVILIYWNYLPATYLPSLFSLPRLENISSGLTTEVCFES